MPSFNCACEDTLPGRKTLSELRVELMRRLGFSAQVDNPPPGMNELLTSFLQDAQEQLYRRYDSLRTERIYSWPMVVGERYYGIDENDPDDSTCILHLDPYKVSWVGVTDQNDVWYPLIQGIPPELYTRVQLTPGWPTRYEIRSCIEVFPAPQAPYTLRVKGQFGLEPFAEDNDTTTIDSRPVFLLALGLAKAHYGRPDAPQYFSQAMSYVGGLVSGAHHTARYIPSPRLQVEALTPPRMVQFDD